MAPIHDMGFHNGLPAPISTLSLTVLLLHVHTHRHRHTHVHAKTAQGIPNSSHFVMYRNSVLSNPYIQIQF